MIDLGRSVELAHFIETIIEILAVLIEIKTDVILRINTTPIIAEPYIITSIGQLER